METDLTVREAAAALGVSTRTLRRHLQAGKLSSEKTRRGQQEVRIIQAAELIRFAQVNGYTLRTPGAGTEGRTGAQEGTEGQTGGQGGASATLRHSDTEGQTGAQAGATYDTEGQGRADRGGQAAARIAGLEAQLAGVTQERDFLRQVVLNLTTKALPPAEEERRSWWGRLWGKGERP